MKFYIKLILVALFINSFSNGISQNDINWISWDKMIQQRALDSVKKKVFIDLYTNWCGWCKRMDATTFSDPVIVNYIKNNFYTVKFDGETKDTIVFNNHYFYNSDPNYKKSNTKMRGKAHWFAHSILDGKLSYPSYVLLDENLIRLMVYQGYKQVDEMLGILLFFGNNQYKYYHNHLNSQWNSSKKL
jgi:thioredoxin-related protein